MRPASAGAGASSPVVHRRRGKDAPAPAILAFAVLSLALSSPARADDALLEEVVAVVDSRSILLSELVVEARLMRAKSEGAASLLQALSAGELRAALDRLIDRLVVYAEAERLQVFELGPSDVQRGIDDLAKRFGPEFQQFKERYEVDDETLKDIVRRDLRVLRYLDGRFRLAARPRDADVEGFVESNRSELPDKLSADDLAELRKRLWAARFDELASNFVADVRRRAQIRVLRDFDNPGAPTPLSGSATAHGDAR